MNRMSFRAAASVAAVALLLLPGASDAASVTFSSKMTAGQSSSVNYVGQSHTLDTAVVGSKAVTFGTFTFAGLDLFADRPFALTFTQTTTPSSDLPTTETLGGSISGLITRRGGFLWIDFDNVALTVLGPTSGLNLTYQLSSSLIGGVAAGPVGTPVVIPLNGTASLTEAEPAAAVPLPPAALAGAALLSILGIARCRTRGTVEQD